MSASISGESYNLGVEDERRRIREAVEAKLRLWKDDPDEPGTHYAWAFREVLELKELAATTEPPKQATRGDDA